MGACYSVELSVRLLDEAGAYNALIRHIKEEDGIMADYALEKYAKQGIGTDTLNNLICIILAGWEGQSVKVQSYNGQKCYSNDFNASYGWEMVMIRAFDVLKPFVAEESYLAMSVDNDYKKIVAY